MAKLNNKNVKIKPEDYVLASKWSDADPYDPWYIGFVSEVIIEIDKYGSNIYFKMIGSNRIWKNARKIYRKTATKYLGLNDKEIIREVDE